MKIVFFGCSDYAKPSLTALCENGRKPALVVTKPDAPRGRGRKIYPQEIRLAAEELEVPFEQPEDVHDPEFVKKLEALDADVGVVVSYGFKLREELRGIARHGLINAHASLLPLYRGAAPIEPAIRDGHLETGVSVMRIEEEIDTGAVMLQKATAIGDRETSGELRQRLAELSGAALVEALDVLESGKAVFEPQDDSKSSHAPKIEKADGVISWDATAIEIDRLVRAMTPKPGAQTRLGAKRFIVIQGEVEEDLYGLGETGRVMSAGEEGIRVCTGKDLYRIIRIKPDNGRNMTAGEFVRGHPMPVDARFT